jgi:hypothetical protein
MSRTSAQGFSLDHSEQVSLYVLLSCHEESLDERQTRLLHRVATHLYGELSVSQMEEIEAYYRRLGEHV